MSPSPSTSDGPGELVPTGIDRLILTKLLRVDEKIRLLTARLDALPETAEVERLESEVKKHRRQALTTRRMVHDMSGALQRLRSDAARLRARRRDALASLRVVVDADRRRDLRHDLEGAERRLTDVEEEIAREERTLAVLGHDIEADDSAPAAPMGTGAGTAITSSPPVEELLERARGVEGQVCEQMREEIAELSQRSITLRAELSDEVLVHYLRGEREQGIGAAELAGTICRCCCIELDAASLRCFANATSDRLFNCPECGVLLLRSES